MKYIFILLVIVFQLFAQNYEPEQRSFNILVCSNYYIDTDTSSYFNTDNEILLGWQWDEIDSFQFNIQNHKSLIANLKSKIISAL